MARIDEVDAEWNQGGDALGCVSCGREDSVRSAREKGAVH